MILTSTAMDVLRWFWVEFQLKYFCQIICGTRHGMAVCSSEVICGIRHISK